MKFKYLKFSLREPSQFFGNSVLRPIIPIRISDKNSSLKYAALIDSGADFNIFDAELAEYLGIHIKLGSKETFKKGSSISL